jgi:DNA-directed RNA polymerase specialized sigma24 family protein
MSEAHYLDRGPVVFATTHWTRVLASRGQAPEAQQALSDLCATYYTPVVAVLRGECRSGDEARDLAHAFFERILERQGLDGADPARGRFRSYLLGALKHFLANRRLHARRTKRGGDAPHLPLEPSPNEPDTLSIADTSGLPDDAVFDRAWALSLLERAFDVLKAEAAQSGNSREFEVLKPWLTGDGEGAERTPSDAAQELGWSDGAFRVALHRLRRRFRDVVKGEIAATVASPDDIADELRHLIAALA